MRYKKRCMNDFGQCLEHPQIKIEDIDDVTAGDHLIFKSGARLDHHGILTGVDYVDNILKITASGEPFPEDERKAKVVTKEINYAAVESSLYKVKYGPGVALKRGEVVRRAVRIERKYRSMGDNISPDSQYHLLFNDCERFAYYCKIDDSKSVTAKNSERIAVGLFVNTLHDLVRLWLHYGTDNPIPGMTVGSIVASGNTEAVFTSEDIYRFYQMMQRGTIDEDEFIKFVLKRLLIAVTSVFGAKLGNEVGAELGRMAGFYVAGAVGFILGGILGNITGRLYGRALGEEIVSHKDAVLALLKRYGGSHLHDD